MKKVIKTVSLALVVVGLMVVSCNKKKTTEPDSTTQQEDETSAFTQQSNDVTTADNTADMSIDDAENVLTPSSLSGFKTTAYPGICGATVDTSQIAIKKITINYNGNSCDGLRSRTGSIAIQLVSGTHWRNAGSVISITYTNFKVTVLSTNKSTTLNGTHYITNVSGGIVPHIGLGSNPSTIVRKIRGINLSITFDDGTVRSWSVARKRTWSGTGGVVSGLAISGDTTLTGTAYTEIWGTNRVGHAFTTVINTPVTVNSTCGWFYPTSGVKTHTVNNRVFTITFGTDASGNIVSTGCPNHYKLTWTSLANTPQTYIGTY